MKKILFTLLIVGMANAQDLPSGIFTGTRQRGAGTLDEQYNFYMSLPSTDSRERDQATFKYNMYKEAERNLQAESKPLIKEKTIFDYYLESEREQQKQREEIDAQFPID